MAQAAGREECLLRFSEVVTMLISFTDIEHKYIDNSSSPWGIKDDAPEHVRQTLVAKLDAIYDYEKRTKEELLQLSERLHDEKGASESDCE